MRIEEQRNEKACLHHTKPGYQEGFPGQGSVSSYHREGVPSRLANSLHENETSISTPLYTCGHLLRQEGSFLTLVDQIQHQRPHEAGASAHIRHPQGLRARPCLAHFSCCPRQRDLCTHTHPGSPLQHTHTHTHSYTSMAAGITATFTRLKTSGFFSQGLSHYS